MFKIQIKKNTSLSTTPFSKAYKKNTKGGKSLEAFISEIENLLIGSSENLPPSTQERPQYENPTIINLETCDTI